MKNKINIVGNGKLDAWIARELKGEPLIIATDRAAYWLLKHGITPYLAIGDFDSVNEKELAFIKSKIKNVQVYQPEKDETDMELAVKHAIKLKPNQVTIYGGIGTRFDHTLGTTHLLDQLMSHNIRACIKDYCNEIQLSDKDITIPASPLFQYLSILPYTKSAVVSISGCKYNVDKVNLSRNTTRGISNEIVDKIAHIIVRQGVVMIIQTRDKH